MELSIDPIVTGIIGVLGTVIGGGVTYYTQKLSLREGRKATSVGLRFAVAAEIEAYIGILMLRQNSGAADNLLKTLRDGITVNLQDVGASDTETMEQCFPIYYANISHIGSLGASSGDVVRFYTTVSAVKSTLFRMKAGDYNSYNASQQLALIERELDFWQKTVNSGELLVLRLRHTRSQIGHIVKGESEIVW